MHLNRSNRHVYWDYSSPGRYFITLCLQDSEFNLGIIENHVIQLSPYGEIVKNELSKIPEYNKRAILDEWIIMPDHIHFIIVLGDYDFDNGISDLGGNVGQIHPSTSLRNHKFDLQCTPKQYRLYRRNMMIPKIMGKFKTLSSKQPSLRAQRS